MSTLHPGRAQHCLHRSWVRCSIGNRSVFLGSWTCGWLDRRPACGSPGVGQSVVIFEGVWVAHRLEGSDLVLATGNVVDNEAASRLASVLVVEEVPEGDISVTACMN